METLQAIADLAEICARQGIRHAVLSPGSRCAPLTLAFVRHPEIETKTISDERSAAFMALGIAQQVRMPVALICTSGSALLNYFPAVAEAFFQEIPLLILSADRPPEWIDQWDGQTIYQQQVYGSHVKKSFQFPDHFDSNGAGWHAQRISNEAIQLAHTPPFGPVHINIPLREPFYPSSTSPLSYSPNLQVVHSHSSVPTLSESNKATLGSLLQKTSRILIIPGQQDPDPAVKDCLLRLQSEKNVVVISDSISNMQIEAGISLHDHWLGLPEISKSLVPDLVITFGKSLLSKSLKHYIRSCQVSHWHIQVHSQPRDPFQQLSRLIVCDPLIFLEWLQQSLPNHKKDYLLQWQKLQDSVLRELPKCIQAADFGDYQAMEAICASLPKNAPVHLANSMVVRYANLLGINGLRVYCNRGTSGIDGSVSTAMGCAWTTDQMVFLIIGDMALFYDRNAFWHNYPMDNLRIILLNNHGGTIFRLIEGPKDHPELATYFETDQRLSARYLAEEYGLDYIHATTRSEVISGLEKIKEESPKAKILEIETSGPVNASAYFSIKESIKSKLLTFDD